MTLVCDTTVRYDEKAIKSLMGELGIEEEENLAGALQACLEEQARTVVNKENGLDPESMKYSINVYLEN